MIVMKKCLPRRTFLRGLGATIALPLLDGMVPAFAATRHTAAKAVRRLGIVYVPNGMNMARWTPTAEGTAFEFTPILEPLAPYRDHLLVLSGLCNNEADALPGEGQGDHARGQAAFLTGVHAKKTEGSDIRTGISMDQIAAKELGKETQLASLELALEGGDMVGSCESGISCAYSSTISWRRATTPLPMEPDPRAVFERLFGASGSTDPRARLARIRMDRSILDTLADDLARFQKELAPGDRTRLTEYFEAVRDIERRIQKTEEQGARELPVVDQPSGIPATFEEHGRLMFDLTLCANIVETPSYPLISEQGGKDDSLCW